MKYLLFIISLLTLNVLAQDINQEKMQSGQAIYTATCISCHNDNGDGQTNMQLIVKSRNLTKSPLTYKQTKQIITEGAHFWGAKSDIMPSFKSLYSAQEIDNITYYVVHKFHPNSTQKVIDLYAKSDVIPDSKRPKMLKRGKKIYKRNCSWCHGITGHGDGAASRNPELSIFPYDLTKSLLSSKQAFLYVKYGSHFWGTAKTDMPAWSPKYDDYTLKSVVKYINEVLKK